MSTAENREAFAALLDLNGQDFLFDGVSGRVLTGRIEGFAFEVSLKPGEQHVLTVKAFRDAWGGSLPEVGSYLQHSSNGKKYRVAAAEDDGFSMTVRYAIAT